MELAPICIFSYNRPNHLQRVLEALSKNDLASESVLYIYCDGAKPLQTEDSQELEGATNTAKRFFKGTKEEYEKYLSDIEENRRVAHSATGFKEVHVIIRPQNVGLKDNIVGAVTEIVNQYGRIITLEDDIITSKGFLRYMNDALEVYKDEEKVMHVSAYMWPHRWPLPETFFYVSPYPGGGWATWKRAWQYYNDNTEELYNYWCSRWNEFGSANLRKQLEDNYNGTLRTWFVKWYAVVLKMGGTTLYPGRSLTNNIGFDDTASNCYATHKFDVKRLSNHVAVHYHKIRKCRLAENEIYAFYAGRWYNKRRRTRLINKIKSFLKLS